MATIPQPERIVAIDKLMEVVGEDAGEGGRILHYLQTAFPGFDWAGILRTRAALWQPYRDSGLSIDAFVDEIIRYAGLLSAARSA